MLDRDQIANWPGAPASWTVLRGDAAPKRLAKAAVADDVAQAPDAMNKAMADAGVK